MTNMTGSKLSIFSHYIVTVSVHIKKLNKKKSHS